MWGVAYQKKNQKSQELGGNMVVTEKKKTQVCVINLPINLSHFNLLAPKDIFQKIAFNEKLNGYGHEDTLFGVELKKEGVTMAHIDNPIIHLD